MEAERWRQLQDLFTTARALADQPRERLLEEHERRDPALVQQVRALLAADAAPGIMDALSPHLSSVAELLKESVPHRIGAYRVVSELGRGGMGVVYLADRADGEFQQRVAIKLIASGNTDDQLRQRFLAERQILAGLNHPNIARLLDGGVTDDGRPYLVMEYVDGRPITTYCDDRRLDVAARLRLFADVCAAVQHAHQNLIIHRDLKPSNILVSADARVHLLDFGIAKLIDPALSASPMPLTRSDTRLMTPEYASPEQVRGESLTTASDVYALGVLLYELLSGSAPYQLTTGSPAEVATAVCEQDPERPSLRASRTTAGHTPETTAHARSTSPDRLSRLLAGDLDGIVLMAMRKEPSRRYASADMLRRDIERHLAGGSVLAHRGSRRYRIEKFLRRHRVEAAAAALVFVALLVGLGLALDQGQRARRERDRAEQALAESTSVSNFLLDLFRTADPGDLPPEQLSAVDLLQRGSLRADELSGQPIVHARLLDVIGQISFHLGRLDEARERFEQAVSIRRSITNEPSLDLASSLIHLSWVHRTRNEHDRARPLVREALAIRRDVLAPDHPDVADAVYELGWLAFGPEQEQLYRQAFSILGDGASTAERRVVLLHAMGTNLRRQGRLAEAVAANRDALVVAERFFGNAHHITGDAMIHLGDHVRDVERDVGRAEQLYRQGLELMTRHYGDNSLRLNHGLNSLANLLGDKGDVEAEALLRRALAISRSVSGDEHPRVADQLHGLAAELARQRRFVEAETLARQALDLSSRTLGPGHQVVTTARTTLLARIFDLQRRYQEADEWYRLAFERTPTSSVVVGQMHRDYGLMLLARGDHVRAEQQLLQSLALLEVAYPYRADHPNREETKRALMALYQQMNRPELVARYRVPPGRFIPY
jgi:serine/threonine-protein kinase